MDQLILELLVFASSGRCGRLLFCIGWLRLLFLRWVITIGRLGRRGATRGRFYLSGLNCGHVLVWTCIHDNAQQYYVYASNFNLKY
eukprot:scaffold10108_cov91-Skeletonema_dohrnii-CCMP3373.AAC.2